MNLIHLANFHSTNIGNGALISGLESTLEEDSPFPISWRREPWDDYTFGLVDFDERFVDTVNASDGLIVGGAVAFNGRDYNTRTGSRFELPLELWSKLTKPVIFYGLSYRHWSGQVYHHVDKLTRMIEQILLSGNMVLAVRNDGTKEWLASTTGIESERIVCVPDSAVFVKANEGHYPEISDGVLNVVVSFNDEDAAHRFDPRYAEPGTNRSRDHVIDGLVATVERLAREFSINFILCPHYFDDYRMMSAFLERVRPRLSHQRMVSSGLCRVEHTAYFYGRYRQVDLSLSMRVHSMSPCVGLGTPVVAYTTQDRMSNFMARIGLSSLSVDAFGPGGGEQLFECAKSVLASPSAVRSQLQSARAALREEALQFNRTVFDLVTG